ncbi:30S ribosomal protein S16 [Patescibacteria group bacterium]|nr:30S ribosomal protein S16 [Patescibacteria group bacterium]
MLTIKFSRRGKKNQPFFRIVVLEKSKDPVGDFLEDLGFLNPLTKKNSLKVDRIKYWISQGAQPSGSVHNLLVKEGVIKADKVKVTKIHKKKTEQQPKTKEMKKVKEVKEVKEEEIKKKPQDKS